MTKTQKIIYWVSTLWLALGMVSTGIVQIIKMEEEKTLFDELGYPYYLMVMLGVWKILGVVAILVPRFPLFKEWAYAGFFFAMSGAIISHLSIGHPLTQILPPLLLLILTIVSWYFRPDSKKLITAINPK